MRKDEVEDGKLSHHGRGLGTVTREMVVDRAREIALINGRSEVLQSDWNQAYRELSGRDVREPSGDWSIETAQWDPAPGTSGHRARVRGPHDEQSDFERITEDGVSEAEHDLMVEHTREKARQDEG